MAQLSINVERWLMNSSNKDAENLSQFEGRYSNYFMVGHNAFEFLLDFGHCSPENENAQFHTRIIASPSCAKALFKLFHESLDQYESTFGAITTSDGM